MIDWEYEKSLCAFGDMEGQIPVKDYHVPRGAPVRVVDSKGFLRNHKLKKAQNFADKDRASIKHSELMFRETPTRLVSAEQLEREGFFVFETGHEDWPFMVVRGTLE